MQLPSKGFMANDSASREPNRVMTVLTFVCSYNNCGIIGRPLHPFLNGASAICAAVVTPATYIEIKYLL
jgi:hypothetical protein